MKRPYYRACRKHKEELEDRTESAGGHEILWCVVGNHKCRSWLVLDGNGETLAIGSMNEAPRLISIEMAGIDCERRTPPDRACKRGHYEWVLESDGQYRCRICRRDRLIRKHQAQETQAPHKYVKDRDRKKGALDILAAIERKKLNKKLRKDQRCLIRRTP